VSEVWGRTDLCGCGCRVGEGGFIAEECAGHRNFVLPEDDKALDGPFPWIEGGGNQEDPPWAGD